MFKKFSISEFEQEQENVNSREKSIKDFVFLSIGLVFGLLFLREIIFISRNIFAGNILHHWYIFIPSLLGFTISIIFMGFNIENQYAMAFFAAALILLSVIFGQTNINRMLLVVLICFALFASMKIRMQEKNTLHPNPFSISRKDINVFIFPLSIIFSLLVTQNSIATVGQTIASLPNDKLYFIDRILEHIPHEGLKGISMKAKMGDIIEKKIPDPTKNLEEEIKKQCKGNEACLQQIKQIQNQMGLENSNPKEAIAKKIKGMIGLDEKQDVLNMSLADILKIKLEDMTVKDKKTFQALMFFSIFPVCSLAFFCLGFIASALSYVLYLILLFTGFLRLEIIHIEKRKFH